MSDFETLSVKLNTNVLKLEEIDKRAAELGMNRSQFVTMALQMNINFDNGLWARIQHYSEGLHIPEWLVIQNMLIKRFAEEVADAKVWGTDSRILDEFMSVQENNGARTLTGEELFEQLKNVYIQEKEREKLEALLKRESLKIPLSEQDKQFLFEHRAGHAWFESEEYKKEQEEEQKGREFLDRLLAEGIISPETRKEVSPRMVSILLKGMEDGNFSKEAVIEQIRLSAKNGWEWEEN